MKTHQLPGLNQQINEKSASGDTGGKEGQPLEPAELALVLQGPSNLCDPGRAPHLEDRSEGNSTYDPGKDGMRACEPRGRGARAQQKRQTSASSQHRWYRPAVVKGAPNRGRCREPTSPPAPRLCWYNSQAGCWGSVHLTSPFNFWKSLHRLGVNEILGFDSVCIEQDSRGPLGGC